MIGYGKTVLGVAGTASVIAATILGKNAGTHGVLAQGLLSDTAAAVFTVSETTDLKVIFGSGAAQTIATEP